MTIPKLTPKQREIWEGRKRFNVVAAGRRAGKTVLGVRITAYHALQQRQPVGWFVHEYSLLEETWRDLKRVLEPAVVKSNDASHRLVLLGGGVVEGLSIGKNLRAGRSRKYACVIVDEAAHAPTLEETWKQAIYATLADLKGSAWFLSSAFGKGFFYRLWSRGQNSQSVNWKSWRYTTYDNPHIARSEIENARLELPEEIFRQEFLAEFLDETVQVLLPEEWVKRCYNAVRSSRTGLPRSLAMDISKGTGRDRTVVGVGDDSGLLDLVVSNVIDVRSASELAAGLARQWGVPQHRITYDAGGWAGSDCGRYLESLGYPGAVPYYGAVPGGVRFANRRTRAAWALRRRLDPDRPRMPAASVAADNDYLPRLTRGNYPPAPEPVVQAPWSIPAKVIGAHWVDLEKELAELKYEVGIKIALENKDRMMDNLGHSPDLADMLIMLASTWDVDL